MFGLINRGTMPPSVEHEFENFIGRLKTLWLVEHNEDGTHHIKPNGFDFVPIGAMLDWPTDTPPSGWLICDGSQVSRVKYNALYNVIGTTFGAGDGSTTFNLPDPRGRFRLSKATAGTGAVIGSSGGALDHTHAGGTITGATGATAPGTDTQGAHNHGGATGAHSHTYSFTTGTPPDPDAGHTLISVTTGGTAIFQHTHTVSGITSSDTASISSDGGHSHTVNSHTHSAGTLAASATGSANPAFLVTGNTIILTGVV